MGDRLCDRLRLELSPVLLPLGEYDLDLDREYLREYRGDLDRERE